VNLEVSDIISGIQEFYDKSDIEGDLGITVAIAQFARTVENATLQTSLFNLALSESMLQTVQSVDKANSVLTRMNEAQESFLSGEMNDQEFYDLVQSYQDLFENENFLNDFLEGRELSGYLLEGIIEAETKYSQQLAVINNRIATLNDERETANEARRAEIDNEIAALKVNQNMVRSLLSYRGALSDITENVYQYNQLLKKQEAYEAAGVKSLELKQEMLEQYTRSLGDLIRAEEKNIDNL